MANRTKKNRDNIAKTVSSKIYDNTQKEIVARYVREVLDDYSNSFFNLIDDRLMNMMYDDKEMLSQKMNSMGLISPYWGASGYFDPGASDSSIDNCEGIVKEAIYKHIDRNVCEVILKLNITLNDENFKTTKFIVILTTDQKGNGDLAGEATLATPVFRILSPGSISVGIREVANSKQHCRLEIFAFNVKTQINNNPDN